MSKILIIEDEAAIRRVLKKIISEENDAYNVEEAEDGLLGIEMIKNNDYDLVLCDIKMPKMDGVEVLEKAKKIKPEIPIVMISGHGDLDTAVNTMRLGAFDYISKPPDLNRLLNTVRNALDKKVLIVENKRLKKKVSKNYEMIGESDAISHIKEIIEKHIGLVVDKTVEAAKPWSQLMTNKKQLETVKNITAFRFEEELPITIRNIYGYAEEALNLNKTMAHRMATLPPDEFVGFLRPAFQEDEWI